jgi:hemerythrin-like domain-containing protein
MGSAVLLLLAGQLVAGQAVPVDRDAGDARPASRVEARPTAAFRLHHRALLADLTRLDRMVERLPAQEEGRRTAAMREIVAFLHERLPAHARAEEAALYPAVDARAGGKEPFTAALRWEHRIVDRWIDDLDREARRQRPDPGAFARQANRLLGLVAAHFELEEEVLLPVLDRTMTAREFQEEVADRLGPMHETLPAGAPEPAGARSPSRAGPTRPAGPAPASR